MRYTNKAIIFGKTRYLIDDIYATEQTMKMAVKLGQLEDIEDELGIDLITLFKALKNGCWAKETFGYMGKMQNQFIFTNFVYFYYADDLETFIIHIRTNDYYLKDYGKTWALTKEELEKND